MSNAAKIAELNDQFRKYGIGCGRLMMTRSVSDMGAHFRAEAVKKLREFDAFTEDNNPHGERDFMSFDVQGHTVLAKYDYYDRSLKYGSEDPSDPLQTCRVLTLMLSSDY